MKNLTCVWRNIYNTARATHSRYYKHFAKHACDFSLILLEPCNFLYKLYIRRAKLKIAHKEIECEWKYIFLLKHGDELTLVRSAADVFI